MKQANEKASQVQWIAVFAIESLCHSVAGLVRRMFPALFSGVHPHHDSKFKCRCLISICNYSFLTVQKYLGLIDKWLELYRALTVDKLTVPGLLYAQKLAVNFVKSYEKYANGIVEGDHVMPSEYASTSSTTFPKLHALLHFVYYLFLLGPMAFWTTAMFESSLKLYCKLGFARTNKTIRGISTAMHTIVRLIETVRFQVRILALSVIRKLLLTQ
jgi:hypothetical protein